MRKNVGSQVIGAQMVSATDGSAFTGSVTVYVTGDGGTQAVGSVGSGACTHEGNGFHTYVPAQAETNYDHVAFTFIGTGAIPATIQCYTTFPQTGDSYARLGAPAGASIAADIATVDTVADSILTDTGTDIPATLSTIAGYLDTEIAAILEDTGTTIPGLISGLNDPTAAAIADAVWDELQSGHVTAGSFGEIATEIADILVDTGTTLQAELDGIQADTEDIQTRLPAALVSGRIDASVGAMAAGVVTAAAIATDAIDADALAADAVAEINATVDTALSDYDAPTNAEMVAAFTEIKGATWSSATDTLEAIRDRGDAAWITATGFSTHSAADVWTSGTRTLTANTNLNDPTAAAIADAVWDEVQSGHVTAGTFGRYLDAQVANVEADTQNIQSRLPASLVSGRIDASVGAMATDTLTAAALAADAVSEIQSGLATSASISALNDISAADVATELATYDGPTNAEMVAAFTEIKGATWSSITDTLEAIRDRGDAAWITATGFSTLDAAGVRTAIGLASANLDTQLAAIPTASENATGLLDLANGVEAGITLRQAQRVQLAEASGVVSLPTSTQVLFKSPAGTVNRIDATVTSAGARTSVTLDTSDE